VNILLTRWCRLIHLPLALTYYNLTPLTAYVASVIGNILPVIAILIVMPYCEKYLRKHSILIDRFFVWWFSHVTETYQEKLAKWGSAALFIFVAIPLPITGAWTGSFASYLFKIDRRKSFMYIVAGVLTSGGIVLLLTLGTLALAFSCQTSLLQVRG